MAANMFAVLGEDYGDPSSPIITKPKIGPHQVILIVLPSSVIKNYQIGIWSNLNDYKIPIRGDIMVVSDDITICSICFSTPIEKVADGIANIYFYLSKDDPKDKNDSIVPCDKIEIPINLPLCHTFQLIEEDFVQSSLIGTVLLILLRLPEEVDRKRIRLCTNIRLNKMLDFQSFGPNLYILSNKCVSKVVSGKIIIDDEWMIGNDIQFPSGEVLDYTVIDDDNGFTIYPTKSLIPAVPLT